MFPGIQNNTISMNVMQETENETPNTSVQLKTDSVAT
jgi:hypothetical protein